MSKVTTQLSVHTVADPLGRTTDPWAEFRQVEVLALHWEQDYRHSLGKYSRFFIELENRRFMATRCPVCGQVWAPPRPVCPEHLAVTQWVELSGQGRLQSFSVLHHTPAVAPFIKPPYVLAFVRLDGADTLFTHLLVNYRALDEVKLGLAVRVVYFDGPVTHPIHLMAFEPVRD